MVKNLVFSGAGAAGGAYPGVILVLEKKGLLDNIERLTGTSAGCFPALFLSLRYTAKEIFDIDEALDFSKLKDSNLCSDLECIKKLGLYKGDYLLNWVEKIIFDKTKTPYATFADLKRLGFHDLNVFATDAGTTTIQCFSFATTPDTSVSKAIRCSVSIPGFFEIYPLNGRLYWDGGCLKNYAIDYFDVNGVPNPETLGFKIGNLSVVDNGLKLGHPLKALKSLFNCFINSQDIVLANSPANLARTVLIPNIISAIDFDATTDEKIAMFKAGFDYSKNFFETREIE